MIRRWLTGGLAGAVAFWLVQALSGGGTITAFMGEQIVAAGGYPRALGTLVGWGVHVAVSLAYALLFALVVLALRRARPATRLGAALAVAAVLGWVTALIAPPAISVTIALLAGRGWPAELYPLNTQLGLPFWNHELFFGLNWAVQALPSAWRRR